MHAVPVQMHPNGALISEEVAHIQQPHAKHAKISLHAGFPYVLIGAMTHASGLGGSFFTFRTCLRVLVRHQRDFRDRLIIRLAEKRRIQINELYLSVKLFFRKQPAHAGCVIAIGQHPDPAFLLFAVSCLQTFDQTKSAAFLLFVFNAALLINFGQMLNQSHPSRPFKPILSTKNAPCNMVHFAGTALFP